MQLTSLVRFRKQVEDLVREELALAEWERSQEEFKRETLQRDMYHIALELERNLRNGIGQVFAEERFKWLEETAQALERVGQVLKACEQKIEDLREKLREAYQARRVVEMVIARKEQDSVRKRARTEQNLQDEVAALKYFQVYCEKGA